MSIEKTETCKDCGSRIEWRNYRPIAISHYSNTPTCTRCRKIFETLARVDQAYGDRT